MFTPSFVRPFEPPFGSPLVAEGEPITLVYDTFTGVNFDVDVTRTIE